MIYRTTEIQPLCGICRDIAPQICRNCKGPHCEDHLQAGVCAGCQGQLWSIERKLVQNLGSIYGFLGIPAAVIALFLTVSGGTAWLGFMAMFLLPLGYFSIPVLVRPVLGKALANKALTPTSRPLLPLPKAEELPAQAQTEDEEAYARRSRKHRSRKPEKKLRVLGGRFYMG